MPNREATNTKFIVFSLTHLGLEPTIYHIRGKDANHYFTDVGISYWIIVNLFFKMLAKHNQQILHKSILSIVLML